MVIPMLISNDLETSYVYELRDQVLSEQIRLQRGAAALFLKHLRNERLRDISHVAASDLADIRPEFVIYNNQFPFDGINKRVCHSCADFSWYRC